MRCAYVENQKGHLDMAQAQPMGPFLQVCVVWSCSLDSCRACPQAIMKFREGINFGGEGSCSREEVMELGLGYLFNLFISFLFGS